MRRKVFTGIAMIIVLALIGFFALAPGIAERGQNKVVAHAPWPVSPAAQALTDRLIIGDWHADPLLWDRDLTRRFDRGHQELRLFHQRGRGAAPRRTALGRRHSRALCPDHFGPGMAGPGQRPGQSAFHPTVARRLGRTLLTEMHA